MIATKAPIPEGLFTLNELEKASYYMQIYNTIMKCKALGIPAPPLDLKTLDRVYTIYDKINELSSKIKK